MNVIATKIFVDNLYNRCYIHLLGVGNNFSNSTLHLNDTLKFVGYFLVYYVFTLTKNLKDAEEKRSPS